MNIRILAPSVEDKEVTFERFVDENDAPIIFKVRTLSYQKRQAITRKAEMNEDIFFEEFQTGAVEYGLIEPTLADLMTAAPELSTLSRDEFIKEFFTAEEIAELANVALTPPKVPAKEIKN